MRASMHVPALSRLSALLLTADPDAVALTDPDPELRMYRAGRCP